MPRKVFQIPTMVSEEDVEVVENALRQMKGTRHVELNLYAKEVSIQWDDPTSWHEIHRTLTDLGYVPEA